MAITPVDINENFSGVTGVYVGQGSRPLFLGERTKRWVFDLPVTGRVAIGFDTRVAPAQVRIFLDKGDSHVPGTELEKFYGLVMTCEYRFDGLPIPPSVYAPALHFQDRYSNFTPSPVFYFGRQNPISPADAVVMMDPDQLGKKAIIDPYFPYNAACYAPGVDLSDSFKLNQRNGFQAAVPPGNNTGDPLCASLFAPIGLDVDGPSLSFITKRLNSLKKNEIEPVASFGALPPQEMAEGRLLGTILAALEITPKDVLKVQMVGPYPLLTLMDAEGYFPRLLANPETGDIYSMDGNELEELQFLATSDLFERFVDFYNYNSRYSPSYPSRHGHYLRSYGQSKRITTMLSGGAHTIECGYKVYAVGRGSVKHLEQEDHLYHCFGGVTWTVRKTFDRDGLLFDDLEIAPPRALPLGDVINYNVEVHSIVSKTRRAKGEGMPELSNYVKALRSSLTSTTDQDRWFITYPPPDTDLTGL